MGAYLGFEAILRVCVIVVPLVFLGLAMIYLGVSVFYDTGNLTPVLGKGVGPVFLGGALKISSFSAIILLFVFAPFIKTHRNFKKIGFTAIILSGTVMLVSVLVYALVIPYPTSTEFFLPIFQLSRLISIGRFFQRIESLFILFWASSAYIYLAGGLFSVLYIIKKTFGISTYRPLIIPMAVLVFNLSLLPGSLIEAVNMETKYIRSIAWIFAFAIPIVVLLIASIRKGKKKMEAANEK